MIAVQSFVRQLPRAPAERRVDVCGACKGSGFQAPIGRVREEPVRCRPCKGEGLVWVEVRLVVPGRSA